VILARTRAALAFSEIEDREGWHGRPLPAEMAERAVVELGGEAHVTVRGPRLGHGRPEGEPHPCQRFTPIPSARFGSQEASPARGNGGEAQECIQAAEQDCDHVASRNLPLRHACHVEVSTIRRSAQSAFS
jgi:hypothetical protein